MNSEMVTIEYPFKSLRCYLYEKCQQLIIFYKDASPTPPDAIGIVRSHQPISIEGPGTPRPPISEHLRHTATTTEVQPLQSVAVLQQSAVLQHRSSDVQSTAHVLQ